MIAAERAGAPAPFPWDAIMAFGLGVLRHSSRNFWQFTPHEIAAAWRGMYGDAPSLLTRSELDALLHIFPDEKRTPA
ncbi:MAG: rcc01693 family protein [Beijerinckiaceae bacterium]